MKRSFKYIVIALFFALLFVPSSFQLFYSIQHKQDFPFVHLFTDNLISPYLYEQSLNKSSQSFYKTWKEYQKQETVSLDSVLESFIQWRDYYQSPNPYVSVDSFSSVNLAFNKLDSLLNNDNEPAENQEIDSLIFELYSAHHLFSLKRFFSYFPRYGFLTSRYLRAYEDRLEKENQIAINSRTLIQNLFWHTLKNPGEKAYLGSNDWLFYKNDVSYLTMPPPLIYGDERPVSEILAFQKDLLARGIELLVVVVPSKASIYPEFFSRFYEVPEAPSHSKRFLLELNQNGVHTVDLFSLFIKDKENDTHTDYLYLNMDTHWTPRGAMLAAKSVAQKLDSMGFKKGEHHYADTVVSIGRLGDVAEMTSLLVFPSQKVDAYQVIDSLNKRYQDDFKNSEILLLGDSFSRIYQTDEPLSAGFIAHLAKELRSPLASIVSDGGASTLVRESLARRSRVLRGKKLVIWEFVERDFRFGVEGWKRIPL